VDLARNHTHQAQIAKVDFTLFGKNMVSALNRAPDLRISVANIDQLGTLIYDALI